MCLGIPVEVIRIKGSNSAVVNAGGIHKEICVQFLKNLKKGDYVLLHAGFAIQKIYKNEARKTLKILKELAGV